MFMPTGAVRKVMPISRYRLQKNSAYEKLPQKWARCVHFLWVRLVGFLNLPTNFQTFKLKGDRVRCENEAMPLASTNSIVLRSWTAVYRVHQAPGAPLVPILESLLLNVLAPWSWIPLIVQIDLSQYFACSTVPAKSVLLIVQNTEGISEAMEKDSLFRYCHAFRTMLALSFVEFSCAC